MDYQQLCVLYPEYLDKKHLKKDLKLKGDYEKAYKDAFQRRLLTKEDHSLMNNDKYRYLQQFKTNYYCKVNRLKNYMLAMNELNRPIYFGTLTLDNSHIGNKESSLKKQTEMFLRNICDYYCYVSEYGELNNRLHFHFICVLKENNTELIKQWHSRQNYKQCNDTNKDFKKISRYMVKYMTKDGGRLHTSKALAILTEDYKKKVHKENVWPTFTEEEKAYQKELMSIFEE